MRTITGTVVSTERAGTSSMGNPTYLVLINTGTTTVALLTESNSGLAYGIGNREYRERAHTFNLNRYGRIRSVVHD